MHDVLQRQRQIARLLLDREKMFIIWMVHSGLCATTKELRHQIGDSYDSVADIEALVAERMLLRLPDGKLSLSQDGESVLKVLIESSESESVRSDQSSEAPSNQLQARANFPQPSEGARKLGWFDLPIAVLASASQAGVRSIYTILGGAIGAILLGASVAKMFDGSAAALDDSGHFAVVTGATLGAVAYIVLVASDTLHRRRHN